MDPLSPSYPSINNATPSSINPARIAPMAAEDTPGAHEPDPSPGSAPANSPSWPKATSPPPKPTAPLYSPTKTELDAHPIRQRLSIQRDPSCTASGAAREAKDDSAVVANIAESEQRHQRQADGSEELKAHASHDDMAETNNIEKGDEVSYQWSGARPGGTVTDVATQGSVTMETNRGNEVKKSGEPENPALYIQRDAGSDVVKKASEVDVEEKADGNKPEEKKEEGNGEVKTGEKRAAEDDADEKKDEEGEAKKQKTEEPKENGDQPKKKGRPAKGANGSAAPKKEKKPPKKAATETGEPRRSGRNAGK